MEKTSTVRSAGQHRDSRAAHLRESAPRLSVRHSVRHRVEKERAFDAAQREDVGCVDGWRAAGGGVVCTVRALLNTFTAPGHQRAHAHRRAHTSVHHQCDRMHPHATSKASPIIINSRIWFDLQQSALNHVVWSKMMMVSNNPNLTFVSENALISDFCCCCC